jgi:nucleoside phosphorylase
MKSVVAAAGIGVGIGVGIGYALSAGIDNKTTNSKFNDIEKPPQVLLLVNGDKETSSLVSSFNAFPSTSFPGSSSGFDFGQLYETKTNVQIFTIGTNVGEEAVVTSLVALLSERKFDLVIVLGCCGALSSHTTTTGSTKTLKPAIGDVIASFPTTSFFERRIAEFGPCSKRLGIGETPVWEYTQSVAKRVQQDLKEILMTTNLISGKMASGRSFSTDQTGYDWMTEMEVVAKDMEAAAAISTCKFFNVPATALKVVVDLVHDTFEGSENDVITTFDKNHDACVPILTRVATMFVHHSVHQLEQSRRQELIFHNMLMDHSSSTKKANGRIIAIHVAMNEEAKPIARSLGLQPTVISPFSKHGMMTWIGTITYGKDERASIIMVSHGRNHQLGMSRVSTQIATFCCNLICRTYGERLRSLINCGTAGAMYTDKHLDIGSVVVADRVQFIDARGLEGRQENYTELKLMGKKKLLDIVNEITTSIEEPIVLGSVGTGSSFDLSPSDLSSLKSLNIDVKEMEAASVVWTCNQWDVPCFVIKSITDFVEHEEGAEEFSLNLYGKALDSLSAIIPKVVKVIAANI